MTTIDLTLCEIQWLMTNFPPVIHNDNKQLVLNVALPPGTESKGKIEAYECLTEPLPDRRPDSVQLLLRAEPDIYDYKPVEPDATEWHVNFADPKLFGFYGGPLFAQDEMQVAEHPCLASLKEALVDARTVDREGNPTPILVKGAERRVIIHTDDIYGNNFARATLEAIEARLQPLNPPTISNIIAMAAPVGRGEYSVRDIEHILVTAYTAFKGAKKHSQGKCVIHTGFWGCGAFGGYKPLMILLQIVAAKLAEVDIVIFHTFNQDGIQHFAKGIDLVKAIDKYFSPESRVIDLIEHVASWGIRWGQSDGN